MFLEKLVRSAASELQQNGQAMKYLLDRKLPPEKIAEFELGLVANQLVEGDNSPDFKLFLERTSARETTNMFMIRNKITIPVPDTNGGYSGMLFRTIGDVSGVPKYTTYLTHGAQNYGYLFGIKQALPSIHKTGIVYVVEGSMDCIAFSIAYPNVVSSLTNFINEDQFYLLKNMAERVVVIFDSDEKGREGVAMLTSKYGAKSFETKELPFKDAGRGLEFFGVERFTSLLKRKVGFQIC